MTYKTLTEYSVLIMQAKSRPHELADLHIELATKYAVVSDLFKDVQIEKAVFWDRKFQGDKPLSDTALNAKWLQTDKGKEELRMKSELKGLEKLMSAIKSSIVVNSLESKNYF